MAKADGDGGVVSVLKSSVLMVKIVRWAVGCCAGYVVHIVVASPLEAECQDAKTPNFVLVRVSRRHGPSSQNLFEFLMSSFKL